MRILSIECEKLLNPLKAISMYMHKSKDSSQKKNQPKFSKNTSKCRQLKVVIGASLSEPHTGELAVHLVCL